MRISAYIRGDVELVRIRDAEGRIAAEGALPYPPGVLCVVPGEVWGGAVQRYFLALEEGVNCCRDFRRSCKVFIAKPMRMA
ncbi:Ornithine decarboxylase [Escherichia coli]|uniref:Ornithine decarboxylase n=1 Tax=Escherichia coli TaxID=562 RepID=A0A377C0D4_ECOLX|nr:Ornithine decarboxylase [Escherichia coli]